jgi:aldehyde dehydrogenase (NAD+)
MLISEILKSHREFFSSGKTMELDFRLECLKKLRETIVKHEQEILAALHQDLRKSEFEAYGTEVGMVLGELRLFQKKLRKWSAPAKVSTSILNFPASGRVYPEPYGSTLIISPWNYPFLLLFLPLIGAIAAGNCVVLKPSEHSPATSAISEKIIKEVFAPEHVNIFTGGPEVSEALLDEKFDYIFYTGSTEVGKIVMQKAAKNLTPVTLELGGKSPCIITPDTDIDLSAKRLAWGKYLNAGQTCVCPDYLLIPPEIKQPFMERMKFYVNTFFGDNPQNSPDFPRIINQKHFERLKSLMQEADIFFGGQTDENDLYIAPTMVNNVSLDSLLMQEEIFGPILPVLEYKDLPEALNLINSRPKPLALYIFSKNRQLIDKIIRQTSSGGVCVNDTITHLANDSMPFGGVGESGMGGYHGKHSFDTFTHYKPVMFRSTMFDVKTRYAPYLDKLKIVKFLQK